MRPDGELARRQKAIELSGWGQPFTFLQPQNLCFWTYLVVVGWGAWQLLKQLAGTTYYAPAYITGLISFGVLGAVMWTALRWLDRYERTPGILLVVAFVWGGIAACFAMAVSANEALRSLLAKAFGQPFQADWGAGIVAPLVEETSKAAGFILLMGMAPKLVRSVFDGLVIGAFIGLGFEILEDVQYAASGAAAHFGAGQVAAALQMFVARATTSLISHALYTALFCAGLVHLIGTVAQPRRVGLGLLLIASALVAHGVWDAAATLGKGGPATFLVLILDVVFCLVMVTIAVRLASRQARIWRRDILAPEVTNGTLTQMELDAITEGRHARKALLHHATGRRGRREARCVMEAAKDLTEDLAASGGVDNAAVKYTRAEIARIRVT